MDKLIPFFYYDIMSRIIPGGVTLALLGLLVKYLPQRWASLFGGEQSWKAVVVPLILGALAYVIGVCYESIDYSAPIKWLVLAADEKAFRSAWSTFRKESGDHVSKKPFQRPGVARFDLWESLVFRAGQERGQNSIFAHCHRFQAEYKMFLHLIYPSLLFAGAALYRCEIQRGVIALFIVAPMLFYFGHRRNERRWLQALCFGEQLDLLNRERPFKQYPWNPTLAKSARMGHPASCVKGGSFPHHPNRIRGSFSQFDGRMGRPHKGERIAMTHSSFRAKMCLAKLVHIRKGKKYDEENLLITFRCHISTRRHNASNGRR